MANLLTDPASVRAQLLRPGHERPGAWLGAIRIHRKDVQQQIFKSLGISEEEARGASASSSTRWSTARRRTEGLRWDWTAS